MARTQQIGFPGLNFMVGEKAKDGARATADYAGRQEANTEETTNPAAADPAAPEAAAPEAGAPGDQASPPDAGS
jgi:hypothetical protein